MNKNIDIFRAFAAAKLNNHLQELHTVYTEGTPQGDALKEGYRAHQKILEQELNDKVDELSPAGNNELKQDLFQIRNEIVQELQMNDRDNRDE